MTDHESNTPNYPYVDLSLTSESAWFREGPGRLVNFRNARRESFSPVRQCGRGLERYRDPGRGLTRSSSHERNSANRNEFVSNSRMKNS